MAGIVDFFRTIYMIIRALIRSFQSIPIDQPEKHVIVITGCDSGFGLMSIYRLIDLKYFVVALCLTEEGVERIRTYCKDLKYSQALVLRCDVMKESDIERAYHEVEKVFQKDPTLKLWTVINNAGIAPGVLLDWFSMDSFRKCLEVNFFAVVKVTKTFLPLLKKCKDSRIINLSSCAGFMGSQNLTAYSASKHAVEGFVKCLRLELMPWNIHVTNINPGFMKTPMVMGKDLFTEREYAKVSQEIKDQYPPSNSEQAKELVHKIAEDPKLVIDCIIDNITKAEPLLNNYPGIQAKIFSWFVWAAPARLKYLIEVLFVETSDFGPYPEVLQRLQEEGK